ncbi:MAG TPA: DUF2628 domain-containing protein, partial [Methyloceanibacter sp.]
MVEYTVYEPRYAADDPIERAERLVFVKDGFRWWAAIFPALWLIVKGLWLELVVFLVAIGALTWGLQALGAHDSVSGTLVLIAQILFGFEAGTIESAALERRGWRRVGWIEGRNRAESEYRFFADWLPAQPTMQPRSPDLFSGPMPKGPISGLAGSAL